MNGKLEKIDAKRVAEYVVAYMNEKGLPITHLKLQKILYYLQGEHLRKFDSVLFDDAIMAWEYGPVVPNVYFAFCSNGALPLRAKADGMNACDDLNAESKKLVDDTIDKYSAYTARQLVQRTHEETPWKQHEQAVQNGQNPEITVDSIREYFRDCEEM